MVSKNKHHKNLIKTRTGHGSPFFFGRQLWSEGKTWWSEWVLLQCPFTRCLLILTKIHRSSWWSWKEDSDLERLLYNFIFGIFRMPNVIYFAKVGDLCESLWFFSRLFTSRPFPIVINTTLLKLSELWRTRSVRLTCRDRYFANLFLSWFSNNFVRANLINVFSSSEGLLIPGNVLNIDEILRRLTAVLQSNDPLARALTLR